MRTALAPQALDQLFLEARTRYGWTDRPVTEDDIHAMYALMKFGPTAANSTPGRFVWVRSKEAKARLEPLLSDNNKAKTMAAPATVIVAYDPAFPPTLKRLFPHAPDAPNWYNAEGAEFEGLRSGTLQGAYLIVAARALGWDCGPMGGFDRAGVDREFLAELGWKSNFLLNIGEGTDQGLFPRLPRLDFDEVNKLV